MMNGSVAKEIMNRKPLQVFQTDDPSPQTSREQGTPKDFGAMSSVKES